MDSALALHTAARRYCLDQHAFWCERYSEIVRRHGDRRRDGYHYTPEALATFPRYNVLNAIRVEIERIDPSNLIDSEETRARLVLVGRTATDDVSRKPMGQIDQRAMAEEREAFTRYIGALSPSELMAVEPLPYRRVLTAEESKSIWSPVRGRWQIPEHYWYPLADCALSDVVAFKTRAFEEAMPHERLRGVLAARGIGRVWELREFGPEYELDISLFKPVYDGAEGYWSSGDLDLIIYASHESSVTVAGRLLQEITAIWPSWQAYVWTGVFD